MVVILIDESMLSYRRDIRSGLRVWKSSNLSVNAVARQALSDLPTNTRVQGIFFDMPPILTQLFFALR